MTFDLDPLEMALGLLPLLPLALFIWFRAHRHTTSGPSELARIAASLSFTVNGAFDPRASFHDFRLAFATALAERIEFNTDEIMGHLLRAA